MEAALSYTPVRPWILASGLAHLGLFAFFVLGPKFSFQVEKPEWVEVTLHAPKPASAAEVVPPTSSTKTLTRPSSRPKVQMATKPAAAADSLTETTEVESADSTTTSGASDAAAHKFISAYEMEVASQLNALKYYPDSAKRMRQQGRVMVRFKLTRDGQVIAREIIEPCAHKALNEAAKTLLSKIREFKPFPNGIAVSSWVFTVPIEYRL